MAHRYNYQKAITKLRDGDLQSAIVAGDWNTDDGMLASTRMYAQASDEDDSDFYTLAVMPRVYREDHGKAGILAESSTRRFLDQKAPGTISASDVR